MEFKKVPTQQQLLYSHEIETRFSDFDHYNHVTSSKYLEFVNNSRWLFLQSTFNIQPTDFTKRNLGLFICESQIYYLKPITNLQKIRIESYADKSSFTSLENKFEIFSQDRNTLYSKGKFKIVTMDLEKNKPQKIPPWALKYFFKS